MWEMILTKEVEIGISSSNKKYYLNKGYDIPLFKKQIYKKNGAKDGYRMITPRGYKIKVKIEDLQEYSAVPIKYECDNCHKIFSTTIHWIRDRKYDNGKIYCNSCSNTIYCGGENHYAYNHNKTDEERENARHTPKDYTWKNNVLNRDKYICTKCKKKCNHDAVAHHLNGFNWCIEQRYDETNGVCLCEKCHKEFHTIYGYGNNTISQFEEWCNSKINIELLKVENNYTYRQYYCVEDDEILYNLSDLVRRGIIGSASHLRECCKDHNKTYRGKHYMFYEDYLKLKESGWMVYDK